MFARQESAWPILAFLALALMFGVGVASAQTRLRGELGADVGIVDFENQLPSNPDPYAVRRALSDQFLKLGLRGSLYDPQLGFYTLRTRIAGQYYGVRSTTGTTSSYTNPQVTALGVQFGMFPGRRYPLRLYYSWSELTALNYEQENRAVVDQRRLVGSPARYVNVERAVAAVHLTAGKPAIEGRV